MTGTKCIKKSANLLSECPRFTVSQLVNQNGDPVVDCGICGVRMALIYEYRNETKQEKGSNKIGMKRRLNEATRALKSGRSCTTISDILGIRIGK